MNNIRKLIQYITPYKFKVINSVICNILSILFSLFSFTMAIPFLGILFNNQKMENTKVPFELSISSISHNFNYMLSQIVQHHDKRYSLLLIIGLVVVMVLFKTFFMFLSQYYMVHIRNHVVKDIRNSIFAKIITLPMGYFTNERKGDIMSRMSNDVTEVEVSVVRSLEIAFKEPITIIVYLVSLIILSFRMTLVILILLPLAGLIIGRLGKMLRKQSLQVQLKLGTLNTIVEETLGGLRIIKAFNSEKKINKKFTSENSLYTQLLIKVTRRNVLATPLSEFLGTLVVVIVMWYGGFYILSGHSDLSSQEFMAYLIIFSQIINPAKSFSSAYYSIQKGLASADRIDQVLKSENTIVEKENAIPIKEFRDSIEYKDVSFKYVENDVLKNINLKIEKGKTIAIVGQSGSGKSTLVDLLPRFFDIDRGEILVDGISIKDYKLFDLRNLMGNVNQESILFNDTIFNNIAFGVDNATIEEVIAAAKVANAHEFIMGTSDQYQTNIGDRGSKLSGGQRQRISIARAVLKNPPVMILDEATSALDTESERLVQDALGKLMENRTSIVIAHRLSTVIHADEICVLYEGRIVERGKHSELLIKGGTYKKLHDLQMFS